MCGGLVVQGRASEPCSLLAAGTARQGAGGSAHHGLSATSGRNSTRGCTPACPTRSHARTHPRCSTIRRRWRCFQTAAAALNHATTGALFPTQHAHRCPPASSAAPVTPPPFIAVPPPPRITRSTVQRHYSSGTGGRRGAATAADWSRPRRHRQSTACWEVSTAQPPPGHDDNTCG